MHGVQHKLKQKWDNTPYLKLFEPLTEKSTKKGWKPVQDLLLQGSRSVRGPSKVPLAYLLREELIPVAQGNDDEDKYADYGSQLISRYPIIKDSKKTRDVALLEEDGPANNNAEVNADNSMLFDIIKSVVAGTS